MNRGRPPGQALKEAKAIALRQGKICENTKSRGILYDFTIHFMLVTIAVSVKRTRVVVSDHAQILASCKNEITRLRRIPASSVFVRELWVRSPIGTWQFFLVLDDLLVEIPPYLLPGNHAGIRQLREAAPGPDRSMLPGGMPAAISGFVCPFMTTSKGT
ncbi:MAG: hypothetical protein WC586_00575 [Methanoregula sp.]